MEKLICVICDCEIEDGQETTKDCEHYCENCFNESFTPCDNCGDYFDENSVTHIRGEYFCEDCLHETHIYCEACGEYEINDSVQWVDSVDQYICDSCLESCYYFCKECEQWFREIDINELGNNEGFVCDDCLSDNYFKCDNCNDYYHVDQMNGDGDCNYCNDCYEEYACDFIKDYHYHKGDEIFYDVDGESDLPKIGTLYFGIENEIVSRYSRTKKDLDVIASEHHSSTNNLYKYEEDGSLTYGFETITEPMTFGFIKQNRGLIIDGLEVLEDNDMIANHECGMHIHVSRSYITNDYATMKDFEVNLKALFEFYKDEIKVLSQRDGSYGYCNFMVEDSKNKSILELKEAVKDKHYRHCVVNTSNTHTIEIRVFKGTTNSSHYFANIEFTKNVIDILKDESVKEFTWKDVLNYGNDNIYLHDMMYDLNIRPTDEKVFVKS